VEVDLRPLESGGEQELEVQPLAKGGLKDSHVHTVLLQFPPERQLCLPPEVRVFDPLPTIPKTPDEPLFCLVESYIRELIRRGEVEVIKRNGSDLGGLAKR
jgi:hypothetical protein